MLSRTLQILLISASLTGTSLAADDPFVGQWKLDPSRSKLTDEMKVTQVGGDKYTFDFGGGNPETVVVNGTDQPGVAGSTLSVAPDGSNWKVVRKTDGRVSIAATWSLSEDGNSLMDDFTSFGPDGSPSNIKLVYQRAADGGSGYAGDWVSKSEQVNSVFTLKISPSASDGLSFTGPSGTTNVKFDGKSARRLDATTLERSVNFNGKLAETRHYKVSPDGRTLTITAHIVGHSMANIFVFDRQ